MNKKPKIVAIVQARMGSTRLPGKSLRCILDKPLLKYEIERIRRSSLIDEVIIATSTAPLDQAIVHFCKEEKIPVYCGSEGDVLNRFFEAAKSFHADVIVRICGDCPLIDPNVIDLVIERYLNKSNPKTDYVSNTLIRTYPRGLDVEVFSYVSLAIANYEAKHLSEREHVTPYLYNHPERFNLLNVSARSNESHHRWTVDTEEDFILVSRIIEHLYPLKPLFNQKDVFELLLEHPTWVELNAHIKQKTDIVGQ